jgi:hypothetical protein
MGILAAIKCEERKLEKQGLVQRGLELPMA